MISWTRKKVSEIYLNQQKMTKKAYFGKFLIRDTRKITSETCLKQAIFHEKGIKHQLSNVWYTRK